jgi:hypothetical protein
MRPDRTGRTLRTVGVGYAITWQDGEGPTHAGVLELLTGVARLRGRDCAVDVRYDELEDVRIGRPARTLLLPRRGALTLSVRPLGGAGVLHELADLLARRR